MHDLCQESVVSHTGIISDKTVEYEFHRMIHPANAHVNMNLAYRTGSARYVCLLDEDVQILTQDWIYHLLRDIASDESIGVVGSAEVKDPIGKQAYLLQTDGEYRSRRISVEPWIPAFVMLFDRERTPWLEFDEDLPGRKGMTDVDACLQLNAHGLCCVRDSGVMVYHPHKGDEASRIRDKTTTKAEEMECFEAQRQYMLRKWGEAYRDAVVKTSIQYELKNQVTQVPEWFKDKP